MTYDGAHVSGRGESPVASVANIPISREISSGGGEYYRALWPPRSVSF